MLYFSPATNALKVIDGSNLPLSAKQPVVSAYNPKPTTNSRVRRRFVPLLRTREHAAMAQSGKFLGFFSGRKPSERPRTNEFPVAIATHGTSSNNLATKLKAY
jgi:hypothetical protein